MKKKTSSKCGNLNELLENLIAVFSLDIEEHLFKNTYPYFSITENILKWIVECISQYIHEHIENKQIIPQIFAIKVFNNLLGNV